MKIPPAFRHLFALATLALANVATAGTPPQTVVPTTAPQEDGWTFRVTPYLWTQAVTGDVGIGPVTANVDASMGDMLSKLDLAFMGTIEATKGRWGVGLDLLYTKIESDVNFSGPLLKSASAELEEWYVTPRFIYTAVKTDRYSMDLIAGSRIFRAETEINVRGRNGGSASANDSTAWVDPIIGIRGRGELGHDFFFNYYGDIGGFGVNSRLTWQALAGIGYNLSKSCSVGIGYRALGMDYDEDGLKIDLISHGPYLGFEFSF